VEKDLRSKEERAKLRPKRKSLERALPSIRPDDPLSASLTAGATLLMANYMKERSASLVTPEYQEVSLIRRAGDVIGSERVAVWFQTTLPALNGRRPLELLDTQEGRQEVADVLRGIEHGDF